MTKMYMVYVYYRHTDGRDVTACAIIGAKEAATAITMSCEAVAAWPHCAKIEGGTCEDVTDQPEVVAALVSYNKPDAQRPCGVTLH